MVSEFIVQKVGSGSDIEKKLKLLMYDVAAERNWPATEIIEGYPGVNFHYWAVVYRDKVVAGFNLVRGDPQRYPIRKQDAWPNLELISTETVEVSLAVIHKEFRNQKLFVDMYAALYWWLQENGVHFVEAILDRNIHLLYRRIGLDFVYLETEKGGGEKIYWGERTFPSRLDITKVEAVLRDKKPSIWSVFEQYRPVREGYVANTESVA